MTALQSPITSTAADQRHKHTTVGLLVLRRQRPGFDAPWGRQVEDTARLALSELTQTLVEPEVGVIDETTLRQALATFTERGCEALVVLQPTMGDLRLIPTLAQQWRGGIVLWATPERPDGDKVSSCSLVAAHAAAALLRQLGRPFEIAYTPRDVTQTRELDAALRVTSAAAAFSRARIGLVGHHAPGFIDMHADPVPLKRQLGVAMHHMALDEMVAMMRGFDDAEVQRDVQAALALDLPRGDITDEQLALDSRYYLAMRRLLHEQHLDALAVRCWPELPNLFGQWAYLAMARLTTEGRVIALEGDVDGAITGLALKLLGLGPGYISDWLEHEGRSITLWHPGHAPLWMCEPAGAEGAPRLGRHFNNQLPIVIDAVLKADEPITICRIWRCDGAYRMTAAEAHTRAPAPGRKLLGAHGTAELIDRDAEPWFQELCHAGMPHHITIVQGHHTGLLKRFARAVNVAWGP